VQGGGFTERLFGEIGAGALLRIEGPIGQFVYRDGTGPMLMIAGGTGFAPLKSMLRHVLERDIHREIHLYWGARTERDVYEESQVRQWVSQHPQLHFVPVLSEPGTAGEVDALGAATDRLSEPSRRRAGWVHEQVLADWPDLMPFDIYAAGPPAMIEAIRATFPAQGARIDCLYFDSFDYAPDSARS
jgi:CDP-4-dehydro-6-deoxyglucose reductase